MTTREGPAAVGGGVADPDRLTRFGVATVVGLVLAFAIHVLTVDGVQSLGGFRFGGDWAPFRTAGELVRVDPDLVLDPRAQREAMAQYFEAGYLVFPYPPLVAYLFVPATWVSFTAGYVGFVALLAGVAVAATRLTLDALGVRDPRWRRVGYLGAVTFAPVFQGYAGAQNSAMTWLLLAGGGLALVRGRPWLAGLPLGLLWYKPQFAVPLVGLLVALRYWRTAAGVLGVGVAFWGANAAVWGADWTQRWWTGVIAAVDEGNAGFSTDITVSVVEWVRWTVGGSTGLGLSAVVAALIGLAFVLVGWTHRSPALVLPLACAALLATAPHALVYEMTLLVPVMGSALVHGGRRQVPTAVALWGLSAVAVVVAHPLVRIPYVALVIGWWLVQVRRADARPNTARARVPALQRR